ncbi:MAG: protein kinase domain-containing protein [Burkholderiales bacterium]
MSMAVGISVEVPRVEPPLVESPAVEPPLVVADRYTLLRPLECNALVTTWQGVDRRSSYDAPVLVKLFNQQRDDSSDRHGELDLHLLRIRGRRREGLPGLLDHGRENGRRFLVFEWSQGEPLATLPADLVAGLSRNQRFELARTLVLAVFAMHEAGYLHLAISPENVLIDIPGGTARLRNWGYMVPLHRHSTELPCAADFSPARAPYVSAELLAGETADPRDDVFAIACIAYQLLSGTHPYRGRLVHKAAQLGWRPAALHILNSRQHALLMKALSFERSLRNVHLDELAAALAIQPITSPASQPASATGLRPSRVAFGAATTAGLVLTYGASQLFGNADETAPQTHVQPVATHAPAPAVRPVSAPSAAATSADAAQIAAELNRRAIFGTGKVSRPVDAIPVVSVRGVEQGIPAARARRQIDPT